MQRIARTPLARWQTREMQKFRSLVLKHCRCTAAAFALALAAGAGTAAQQSLRPGDESNSAALLDKHASLARQLAQNPYRRPLSLESTEGANTISGTAYAVLDSPFSAVSNTFKNPKLWCEVLILHINTKYCRASTGGSPGTLAMSIGKKTAQPLKEAFLLDFTFRVAANSPGYLAVQLNAAEGPLSTRNYLLELQAVPLSDGKTFMRLRYAYDFGMVGRVAMQTYLATLGRGKVGFTRIRPDHPQSAYIGGVRGTIERNTIRYYLAIEAYLTSLGRPPAQQFDARLQYWFDATEQYPRQLHEVDRNSYLVMKKEEYQRQQAAPPG